MTLRDAYRRCFFADWPVWDAAAGAPPPDSLVWWRRVSRAYRRLTGQPMFDGGEP